MTTTRSGWNDPLHWIALTEGAGALALAGYLWRFGPTGPIPMHLDLYGRVDRWGDRTQAALALAGLTLLLALGYLLLMAMDHGRLDESPVRRGLRSGRIVLMLVGALIAAVPASIIFGVSLGEADVGPGRLLPAALALVILVTGALLGKTAPNPVVGVRTYWALKSRLAWDKSNRLAGRLFFWIGALGLVAAPLAPAAQLTAALVIAIIGAAALAVIESWRVWRADPDRNVP